MQPVSGEDRRKPYIQIAASVRAAILSGELEPGSQLPTGEELARFFGVSRMTVTAAMRLLRDEGYVRSRAGSGVYVRDEAQLPVPDEAAHPLAGVAAFLFEIGHLKRLPRAGWLMLTGTGRPESVAEHSFRVGVTAIVLAAMAGADTGHAAALAIFHDGHETRVGDIPSVGRAYLTSAAPQAVTAHQVAAMPDEVGKVFQALTDEYEAGETPEARLARDADKLETMLQAAEDAAEGLDTAAWTATSAEALRTDEAKQLARAIGAGRPGDWYAAFQRSYHELRAGAKERGRALDETAGRPPGER